MQHFPELLETLLKSRAISTEEQHDFLSPNYEKLHDPLLLPDMERARDRIIGTIKNGEHIVIFSDYDADGIPGAVILSDFFSRIKYENISFYIPHRHDEGFGLNLEAIGECAERGAKLIITVDCGISDAKEVVLANENGIDVIITDHHEEGKVLPEAFAIVNPKRKGSGYPFQELCGSAVVFKLIQAILAKESFGIKLGMEKWSLDMVAIATLSDMVPLIGENRILARFGLDVLRKSPRPGLAALFKKLNINQSTISEDDITFMITPRINAASRVKDAKSHLEKREKIGEVIVIGNPEWRPALVGLVANSLVEEYCRPVFVWGRDGDGVLKGSCRSYNGYDLYILMNSVADAFIEFGGHAGAGGFSVTLENLSALEEKLSQTLKFLPVDTECLQAQDSSRHSVSTIGLDDIGEDLWNVISQFAPFGMGNEKPIFKIPKVEIKSIRQFGKAHEHLELTLAPNIKAISFFSTPESYFLNPESTHCTILANLEKSYFRDRPELRLRIIDIKL